MIENMEKDPGNRSIRPKSDEGQENFAELFKNCADTISWIEPGQKIRAKVILISKDLVYIDLSAKSEGIIDISEFKDENGNIQVHEEDYINAYFISVEDGIKKFTTLVRGYPAVSLNNIQDAFDKGLPVSGDVAKEVKGGFEVSVGGVRCFCPVSQVDLKGNINAGEYCGKSFLFRILKFEEEGRNVVLSRRALLEDEKKLHIEKLKESLKEGNEVRGTVKSLQKFGAFIELEGVDAFVPLSEISWERINSPADRLSAGQEITAKILSLDWNKNRVTLSIKALQPDPWEGVGERYQAGSKISGAVVRLMHFGAFVSLEPGVDGLIHISNFGTGRKIKHAKEVVSEGQLIEAYILEVDAQNKKMSLSLQPRVEPKNIALPQIGEAVEGTVEKVMPFGVFLKMPSGLTGLVPNSEMATPPGTDHKRMFPAGMEMQAVVIEVDSANHKVKLSRREAQNLAVQKEYSEYIDSIKETSGTSAGFGSLGDLLKAKSEKKWTSPPQRHGRVP